MKDQFRDIFLQLLRIGLWGEGILDFPKSLNEIDWDQIHRYAVNHTVEGIIYDSFSFLTEEQLPPYSLRLKWTVRVDKIERYNQQMNKVLVSQYNYFTKYGLNPILQKGQGVAACYRNPLHRMSGDIDWYFENNGYAIARKIVKEKKIAVQDLAGFSLDYDWENVHIEHHKKLFDIQNPFKVSYLNKLQKKYRDNQQILLINNTPIKLLAPELQIFQINIHILKHQLAFGIGLRQLCDSACVYYETVNQLDSKELKAIYERMGVIKWAHVLHAILVNYLGLPISSLPFPYPTDLKFDWMMDEIWYSGNFGFHDERFEDGKITALSAQPDGAYRLWANFKQYVKFAPQEAFFFPLVQTYSRFLGKDKD
ncbi:MULTISPECIES: nucleotidyltransferase family protein [Sphingobacterium]|uniref:nucleotidyltransferase family protein n=1 Tax=Sphingobacterium TaxID=28453 RepID=UPI00257A2FFA|nr:MULTISPECIES: nucleotidyltransferase family protein [Sphingobacterium]